MSENEEIKSELKDIKDRLSKLEEHIKGHEKQNHHSH
jgi:hypothetical protein